MQQHVLRAWEVRAKGAPRRNASGDLKLRKVSKERDICLRVRGTKGRVYVDNRSD